MVRSLYSWVWNDLLLSSGTDGVPAGNEPPPGATETLRIHQLLTPERP